MHTTKQYYVNPLRNLYYLSDGGRHTLTRPGQKISLKEWMKDGWM